MCIRDSYTTALQVGMVGDVATTTLTASGLVIRNCTNDIVQEGTATLNFNAGTTSSNKITINSATNVSLAYFDLDDSNSLTIGSSIDKDTNLIQVALAESNNPDINYRSSIYGLSLIHI